MRYPNLKEEKKLWQKGYKYIAGLDEAGRGSLAGPVVAAAVVITNKSKFKNLLREVKDSKKLSPKQREKLYKILIGHANIEWATGRVSERVIDKINIKNAAELAMKRAVRKLKIKNEKAKIDFLLLDGKMKLDLPIPQKSIIKADEKVFSCASASIIAKVTRDKIMKRLHKKYPQYGIDRHKGYPTKYHLKMLKKYGLSVIHRKSFRQKKNMIK
ncbi:ribonuclease HII [bacterium]|nr:ribonuclease HII [bacterium]